MAFWNGKLRKDQFPQLELQVAALGDFQRCSE